jgi:predicted dehydrogenase
MDTLGIGIVGCGDIARLRYLPSFADLPDVRLVATCDTDEPREGSTGPVW